MTVVRTPARLLAGCLLAVAVVLSACGQTAYRTPGPSLAAASAESLATSLTGQTDTDWGRIWDAIPVGFPVYAGSTPSDEVATGPASATLVADGDVAAAVATWMAERLVSTGAAARTDTSGPMEDGSYVVAATGDAACQIQVTVAPLGSLTTITILYGASCPSP
jgi:hypothetical protein